MILYARRIGDYTYPNRAEMEVTPENALLTSDAPGLSAGRASFGSRRVLKRIVVKGMLYATVGADRGLTTRQLVEEMEYAHRALNPERNANEPAHHTFWFTEDEADLANSRCFDVSVRSCIIGAFKKPLNATPFTIEMETGEEPFSYSPEEESQALTVDGSTTIVDSLGTAFSYPRFSVTVTRSSAGVLSVINDTNGQLFTLAPTVAGTYVFDSARHTVVKTGAPDTDVLELMGDEFLELEGFNNSLRVVGSGGVDPTAATVYWKPRFQ